MTVDNVKLVAPFLNQNSLQSGFRYVVLLGRVSEYVGRIVNLSSDSFDIHVRSQSRIETAISRWKTGGGDLVGDGVMIRIKKDAR